MNKKILPSILIIGFIISFFIGISNVNATPNLIFIYNDTTIGDAEGLTGAYPSDLSIVGQTIQPSNNGYLDVLQFAFKDDGILTNGAVLYARVYQVDSATDKPNSAGAVSIENSSDVNINGQLSNSTWTWVSFPFTMTHQLTTLHYYAIDVFVKTAGNLNIATHWLKVACSTTNKYTGQAYDYQSSSYTGYVARDCAIVVFGDTSPTATPAPSPTPTILTTSHIVLRQDLILAPATDNGNVTHQVIYPNGTNGLVSLATDFYVPINSRIIWYGIPEVGYTFNKTVYAGSGGDGGAVYNSGDYFYVTSESYEVCVTFSALPEGVDDIICLRVKSPNTGITWINYNGDIHNAIANTANAVDYGVGIGTYTEAVFYVHYNTQVMAYWVPSSKYPDGTFDMFTLLDNDTVNILGTDNPYSVMESSTNNPWEFSFHYGDDRTTHNDLNDAILKTYTTGGTAIINPSSYPFPTTPAFFYGLSWTNILTIVIYAVCCGLGAYAFAFTGLIAGLDVATIICVLAGFLGNLLYPVVGLIAIMNIALIVVGSGLLNRKRNGTDA